MPTYSFYCQDGHETTWFGSYASRPEALRCGTCEAEAVPGIAKRQPSSSVSTASTWREKVENYSGLSLHDFECDDCGFKFEEIIDHGLGENPSDGQTCPCGGHARWVPSCRIDRFSERFPYFDRGLGVWLKNKQHRLDVCKQKNLTPVEGDWDEERYYSKLDSEDDKLKKGYEDYCDRLDNAPAFRDYRKARDQGRI